MKHQYLKRAILILLAVLLISGLGIGLYAADYYHMDQTALSALESSDTVTVALQDGLAVFHPENPTAGLIFYPGGKVEYTAYAPLMQLLAREGILCVIPQMPLNLAVLDLHAADHIPAQFPEIHTWYIGGHSLGGSMAASCAAKHDTFSGLVLLASYSTADLTGGNLQVISIYGTEDGVLNLEKYEQYRENLPEQTTERILTGGNHAQFGDYGLQDGDGTATISPEQQLQSTVTEILAWMQ